MRLAAAAFLLLFSLVGSAQDSTVVQTAHKTTYHIGQETVLEGDKCSATAVGPHALLTASHCELPTDDLSIEGAENTVHVDQRLRDGNDHTLLLLSGITFKTYAQIDIKNTVKQGDDVFMFGNPGAVSDLYRRGYMAGNADGLNLFDINDWHGDSGAALFGTDGRIDAVLTGRVTQGQTGDSMTLVMSFPFKFRQCDIDVAHTWGVATK